MQENMKIREHKIQRGKVRASAGRFHLPLELSVHNDDSFTKPVQLKWLHLKIPLELFKPWYKYLHLQEVTIQNHLQVFSAIDP